MNRTRKKWEDCKVFLMCTLLVLLLPFGFLFFFIPGKILDAVRMRQYRKRRETTRWQPPVSGEDFLRGCEISPDSPEAEVALDLRRKLAQATSAWCHKITAEEIAPDMTCGELVLGWSSYMYWHDGLDSIGYEAVKKLGKGKIPEEVFPRLIRPEKKSRVTMRELFRNYLDVLMPYLQNVPLTSTSAKTRADGDEQEKQDISELLGIIPDKEQLEQRLAEFYQFDSEQLKIRKGMETLQTGELLALANFPNVRDCVLENVFIVLKHRTHWAEILMYAYRNKLLTRRTPKMYMLSYLNTRGNQYPDDLNFYLEVLNDRSKDVVSDALFAVTFFNHPEVIPRLVEMRKERWESVSLKAGWLSSMSEQFSLAIASLRCGNPYIAYPFSKDCNNRWGFLALWENEWSRLDQTHKKEIIAEAFSDTESETEAKL